MMSQPIILLRVLLWHRRQGGFTLVELITVMVLMGILSASFMLFFKPTIDGYFDARRRADLTDIADTALRRMHYDIKKAVPNSLYILDATTVSDGAACFQLVTTTGGGRFRMGPDTVNDTTLPCSPSSTCSAWPEPTASAATAQTIDLMALQGNAPVQNDYLVINNQNRDNVYDGSSTPSRYLVSAAPSVPRSTDGLLRLGLGGNPVAAGYAEGRYQVVSQNEKSVVYSCSGGKLYRQNTGSLAKVSSCPAAGDLLATDVQSCEFVYDPNIGATQQSGYLWMTVTISRSGEAVRLAHGSHVDNQP